ncbi:MAG: hypothetical protein QOH75_3830 [Actinomycetota bacterium]|nr:hypothetical protein [Actinomycetota bacterium]
MAKSMRSVAALPSRAWPIGSLAGPLVFLVTGGGYLALTQFVVWLNDPVNTGAGLWPAARLSVGASLLLPTRLWAWVVAAVVLPISAATSPTAIPSRRASADPWQLCRPAAPKKSGSLEHQRSTPGRSTRPPCRRCLPPSQGAGHSQAELADNSAGNSTGNSGTSRKRIMGPRWGRTVRHRSAQPITGRRPSCPLTAQTVSSNISRHRPARPRSDF